MTQGKNRLNNLTVSIKTVYTVILYEVIRKEQRIPNDTFTEELLKMQVIVPD